MLRTLCEIEMDRIAKTKMSMMTFVNMSVIELPMAVGKPIADEMLPCIGKIDAVSRTLVTVSFRCLSLHSHWYSLPNTFDRSSQVADINSFTDRNTSGNVKDP